MRNMRCELIGPGRLDYYIYNPYAVLIDVRPREMYNRAHITGALKLAIFGVNTFEGYRSFANILKTKEAYMLYTVIWV